jgi:dolichyl-phosphate-mannose-protein mannosyltransferase
MICFVILLGPFIYAWGKRWFGPEAGAAALFIYALDPNFLAHSAIVHTDVPFATFFFISTYYFCQFSERATWLRLAGASVFAGLASVTKFSYIVILPVWIVLGILTIVSHPTRTDPIPQVRVPLKKTAMLAYAALGVCAVTWIIVWASYGFHYHAIPGGKYPLDFAQFKTANTVVPFAAFDFLARQRLFPEGWIFGQLYALTLISRPAYLMGNVSPDGFWSYFPVAFLIKTPLPTLILIFGGLWLTISHKLDGKLSLSVLTPPVVYFLFAVLSRYNIGLRHILPIYPFLFVFAGAAASELWKNSNSVGRYAMWGLGIWYLASCLLTFPNYLPYFNELIAGPRNGHKFLIDSNLDWGQDLKGLKMWMDQNHVSRVRFLYFGTMSPEDYGIDASYEAGNWFTQDTSDEGQPEFVVISATLLYGAEIFLPGIERAFAEKYRARTPVAVIGHSLYVFRL